MTPQSSSHKNLSSEIEVDNILSDLEKGNIFHFQCGRQHKTFLGHAKSIIQVLDTGKVLRWLKLLVKKFTKGDQAEMNLGISVTTRTKMISLLEFDI